MGKNMYASFSSNTHHYRMKNTLCTAPERDSDPGSECSDSDSESKRVLIEMLTKLSSNVKENTQTLKSIKDMPEFTPRSTYTVPKDKHEKVMP